MPAIPFYNGQVISPPDHVMGGIAEPAMLAPHYQQVPHPGYGAPMVMGYYGGMPHPHYDVNQAQHIQHHHPLPPPPPPSGPGHLVAKQQPLYDQRYKSARFQKPQQQQQQRAIYERHRSTGNSLHGAPPAHHLAPVGYGQHGTNHNQPTSHRHHMTAVPGQVATSATSYNGTTFYFPSVPLDQMPPAPSSSTTSAHAAPPLPKVNKSAPVGGVSATLDYELETMAGFLAEMSAGVMCRGIWNTHEMSAFRKFIFQVLTATRLPKSTIVLSLVYLSKRWALPNLPDLEREPMSAYKMLIVSLLLSNKFNDDNTFTNQSWFEATGIAVSDLTAIETSWLREIQWSLFLHDNDLKGWHKWDHCWSVYLSRAKPVSGKSDQKYPVSVHNEPAATNHAGHVSQGTSPAKQGYTIPQWFETAHKQDLKPAPVSVPEYREKERPFVSYFQQSFVGQSNYDEEKAIGDGSPYMDRGYNSRRRRYMQMPHPSYYMPAYTHMASCNCNVCVFEPVRHRGASPSNRWFSSSSVVAC